MGSDHARHAHVITGKGIDLFRLTTMIHGLQLEEKGIKMTRGPSIMSRVKREFGFKGNRAKIIAQLEAKIREAREAIEPGEIRCAVGDDHTDDNNAVSEFLSPQE